MRLPRDLSGATLVKKLGGLGYVVTRQSGSHARLTTETPSTHHITVPMHDALRVGTLSAIVTTIAEARGEEREELLQRLFG